MTKFRKVMRDGIYEMVPYEELSLVELVNILLFDYGDLERYLHSVVKEIKEIKDDINICLKPFGSYDYLKTIDVKSMQYKHLRIQLDELYNKIEYKMDLLHGKV